MNCLQLYRGYSLIPHIDLAETGLAAGDLHGFGREEE
jgi:hypothetical protein